MSAETPTPESAAGDYRDFRPETITWEEASKPDHVDLQTKLTAVVFESLERKYPGRITEDDLNYIRDNFIIEIISNALYHGSFNIQEGNKASLQAEAKLKYNANPQYYDNLKIVAVLDMRSDGFSLSIRDFGKGFDFNLETVPDPTAPENLLKTSGRGIRSYVLGMGELNGFETQIEKIPEPDHGTKVTITKKF